MSETITLQEASVLWLKTLGNKVAFFHEQFIRFLTQTRDSKKFEEKQVVKLRKDANIKRLFAETIDFLESHNFIESTNYNYHIIKNTQNSELEIICSLYPHGYISYLTAMRVYNLTNRFPKSVDFVALNRKIWKSELSNNQNTSPIPYPSEFIKFNNKKINLHPRKNLMPFVHRGQNIRVIEIGCLFLEMLRSPNNCGGFQHVFEIYEEMGKALSEEILKATEDYGTNIDKSRVGYIFEKYLGVDDNRIQKWKKTSVSRGGSRKMIAENPYSNIYDEDWNLSLNHAIFE